ncbi:MAG: hypothetical protein ACT4QE_23830 [Anaerolineales bacterium]
MFTFDPDRVAYAEAHGWRAYYDHNWLRMLQLVVAINEAQFGLRFPQSWQAAYFIVRASAAWAPLNHDLDKVRAYLRKYYTLVRGHVALTFDPQRAAEAELVYWDVHRRLSIAKQADKSEFVEAMVRLHSEIFGITPEQARESAEQRVLANNVVDTITSKTATDPEADWARLEDYLRRCYRSIAQELSTARVAV